MQCVDLWFGLQVFICYHIWKNMNTEWWMVALAASKEPHPAFTIYWPLLCVTCSCKGDSRDWDRSRGLKSVCILGLFLLEHSHLEP